MDSIIAGQALACEISNTIDARRIVNAIGRQAFVNVVRAIIFVIAGRTCAGIVFRWTIANATVLTVLD